MNFLISFCLNNRITVILLTIALAIISPWTYSRN